MAPAGLDKSSPCKALEGEFEARGPCGPRALTF